MSITKRMNRMLTREANAFTAPTLGRYLADPAYRARLEAERVVRQAEIAAPFEARDRARQEAAWARDELELAQPDTRNQCTGDIK